MEHLLISCPEDWSNDQRGAFFETFVGDLLRPMRLKVVERLRFTGMEIDLLARGEDQPKTILVECKAQRDPLSAEVISKLLGNVDLRHADSGWLFSASDFSKDGRAQWEEIQNDSRLSRKFMWFAPERTISVLKQQRVIVDPASLSHHFSSSTQLTPGNWTLVISPSGWHWLVQLVESGIPVRFTVLDARIGKIVPAHIAGSVAAADPRFSSLELLDISESRAPTATTVKERPPVARVISGDSWDDLRPASPSNFVGRDDLLKDITDFFGDVRDSATNTRTFAIEGPSGWGKSSLVLKISHSAARAKLKRVSVTAVDTRSAINSAFVSEALRVALTDAVSRGVLSDKASLAIDSLRDPLDSRGIQEALQELLATNGCVVLIFDQFEELFSKEHLFETFNAIRELSLDIDAQQLPFILGFAWKTDVSLPQQHPAYFLWHQLHDRRRTFKIREFGSRDIQRIIGRAQRETGKRLSAALSARIREQSQNLPWLLKKLLVHVLQRISGEESQYLFLERELDVELLFKEDLSVLGEEHLRCLSYVAQRAPVAVADVEENFSRDAANLLINRNLLVRSGMNYVVYWDIFRDYLVDQRVPHIPWARTFQRGPLVAVRALHALASRSPASIPDVGRDLGLKEGPAYNLFGDLVALQLVESPGPGIYVPNRHLTDLKGATLAEFVQSQLRRHVVVRALANSWEKEKAVDGEHWPQFFEKALPRTAAFSVSTIHQYANTFKNWLLFAGLLEQRERYLVRPSANGRQMGLLSSGITRAAAFLGTASPAALERLLGVLFHATDGRTRKDLEADSLRNAVADASAVGLVIQDPSGRVKLVSRPASLEELIEIAKKLISDETTTVAVVEAQKEGVTDPEEVGRIVEQLLGARWKRTSVKRYGGGLVRYAAWSRPRPSTLFPALFS